MEAVVEEILLVAIFVSVALGYAYVITEYNPRGSAIEFFDSISNVIYILNESETIPINTCLPIKLNIPFLFIVNLSVINETSTESDINMSLLVPMRLYRDVKNAQKYFSSVIDRYKSIEIKEINIRKYTDINGGYGSELIINIIIKIMYNSNEPRLVISRALLSHNKNILYICREGNYIYLRGA